MVPFSVIVLMSFVIFSAIMDLGWGNQTEVTPECTLNQSLTQQKHTLFQNN